MTMDLHGPQGEEHTTNNHWQLLLELALLHGWSPAGTIPGDPEEDEDDMEDMEEDEYDKEDAEDEGDAGEAEDEGEGDEGPDMGETSEAARPPVDTDLLAEILRQMRRVDPRLMPYMHNSGPRVTPEDSRALADALEQALPDLPDHDALAHKAFEHPQAPGERFIAWNTPVTPMEMFSGKNKQRVRDFITFFRGGGFVIW